MVNFKLSVISLSLLLTAEAWISTPTSRHLSKISTRQTTTPKQLPNTRSQLYQSGDDSDKKSSSSSNNNNDESASNKGIFDFLSPYDTKIPPELRDEIYAAEANTPAAQERSQRVLLYIVVAFVGILAAFFNGFLTELRTSGPDGSSVDLSAAGFDWVVGNPIFGFLFLNKIGGGLSLLGGAGAGLMAEAELDTKRINAEKIYEELERRRQSKTKKTAGRPSNKFPNKKKKKRPGKEKKRLGALAEVISTEKENPENIEKIDSPTPERIENEKKEEKGDGLLGSMKNLYDKADSMAASQALLLNKKLEDAGVVDKITDETGLKVIGKEEASKLQQDEKTQD